MIIKSLCFLVNKKNNWGKFIHYLDVHTLVEQGGSKFFTGIQRALQLKFIRNHKKKCKQCLWYYLDIPSLANKIWSKLLIRTDVSLRFVAIWRHLHCLILNIQRHTNGNQLITLINSSLLAWGTGRSTTELNKEGKGVGVSFFIETCN